MMIVNKEIRILVIFILLFLGFFYLPIHNVRFSNAVLESLMLLRWYAREHVILCLIPAFFIAGAIGVFVSQASVMRYFGVRANKILAFGVASVSGTILAVCSCTVLPLFAGIYRMGAGLGPAVTFLYSGPAINVLAIILTARVLGPELGVARAIGAVLFSLVIGVLMHIIFLKEEMQKSEEQATLPQPDVKHSLVQNVLFFALMVVILVFANWGQSSDSSGLWHVVYIHKWLLTGISALLLSGVMVLWFGVVWWKLLVVAFLTVIAVVITPHEPRIPYVIGVIGFTSVMLRENEETQDWVGATWGFAKQILPLLAAGVLVAGFLLGRPGHEGLIPSRWIEQAVGGNSVRANLLASIVGALMYFATLTEVPILEGLIGSGMGKGPALALLLAGPAVSLPNLLVIRSIMGAKKTFIFLSLVVVMATVSGIIFGTFF